MQRYVSRLFIIISDLTMYTDAEKRLAVFIEENVEDEDITAYLEQVCHSLNHCLLI
jgi:hypothetical protein